MSYSPEISKASRSCMIVGLPPTQCSTSFVSESNKGPSATMMFALSPCLIVPTRSETPSNFAGTSVIALKATSMGKPLSTALRTAGRNSDGLFNP